MAMSLSNNQFTVRWTDNTGKDRSKVYSDYDTAIKAYKWLIANGAEAPDLAVVKRVSPSKPDIESEPS